MAVGSVLPCAHAACAASTAESTAVASSSHVARAKRGRQVTVDAPDRPQRLLDSEGCPAAQRIGPRRVAGAARLSRSVNARMCGLALGYEPILENAGPALELVRRTPTTRAPRRAKAGRNYDERGPALLTPSAKLVVRLFKVTVRPANGIRVAAELLEKAEDMPQFRVVALAQPLDERGAQRAESYAHSAASTWAASGELSTGARTDCAINRGREVP